jgi:Arc/MetJ-type ribon-helix-helix transcriptional regulator
MKIVTVNVPESYLDAIQKLIGDGGLYPSRSELVRAAIKKFLLKELKMIKQFEEMQKEKQQGKKELNKSKFVQVPIERETDDNEPIREFKTYKIVRKLDF